MYETKFNYKFRRTATEFALKIDSCDLSVW